MSMSQHVREEARAPERQQVKQPIFSCVRTNRTLQACKPVLHTGHSHVDRDTPQQADTRHQYNCVPADTGLHVHEPHAVSMSLLSQHITKTLTNLPVQTPGLEEVYDLESVPYSGRGSRLFLRPFLDCFYGIESVFLLSQHQVHSPSTPAMPHASAPPTSSFTSSPTITAAEGGTPKSDSASWKKAASGLPTTWQWQWQARVGCYLA